MSALYRNLQSELLLYRRVQRRALNIQNLGIRDEMSVRNRLFSYSDWLVFLDFLDLFDLNPTHEDFIIFLTFFVDIH